MSKQREIERRLAKLEALEAGGVDNWEFYDKSLEEWNKETLVEDCIDDAIEAIQELLATAEVDEPAGKGAGFSISFDETEMYNILKKLIEESQ